jgi:uncharacterized membrane protein
MEMFNDFIVLIVMMICLCVGYIIKHLIDTEKVNKCIPLIMAVLGVFLNVWLNGWALTPEILLGGMASGLASTGMHQAFKQFINKNNE